MGGFRIDRYIIHALSESLQKFTKNVRKKNSLKTFFQNSLRNSTSKLASKKSKEKWRIWFLNKPWCFVDEEWNTKNWNHELIIFLWWQFHPSNRLIPNFSIYTLFWQTFYKHQVLAFELTIAFNWKSVPSCHSLWLRNLQKSAAKKTSVSPNCQVSCLLHLPKSQYSSQILHLCDFCQSLFPLAGYFSVYSVFLLSCFWAREKD